MSKAFNKTRGSELARHVRVARSLTSRLVGLLGTRELPDGDALWLQPCQSVHSFFMRYPIDVIFLSREGRVVHAQRLAPWRMTGWVRQADGVLELPAGTLDRSQTRSDDQITLTLEKDS